MDNRSARVKTLSAACSVMLLVVLLLANAIISRASVRVDLTEEGLYTLSEGSREILSNLEDPARIRVFWHDVPPSFNHTKSYVAALLEEMEAVSDDKVQGQWVDMSEDAGLEQASEVGLEQHRFHVRKGSEFVQALGYMSLVIEIGDSEPVKINELANIQDKLEYKIVSAIFKAQRLAPPIIGLVQERPFNPMGGSQGGRFAWLEQEFRRAFGNAFRPYIDFEKPVADDVDVLIVADPRDLTEKQVFHFEQFLLRGGRALVLADPIDALAVMGRRDSVVRPAASGLEDWLAHIGLTLEKGCVVDFHEDASCLFPQDEYDMQGRLIARNFLRYAHWPKVLPENVDVTNPVMRYLQPMAMYWPAAISVDAKKQEAAGRKVTILATTSDEGYRRSDVTNLRRAGISREGKLLERVPLVALVEGPVTSFWKGKDAPGTEKEEAPPAEGEGAPDPDAPPGEAGDPDAGGEDPKQEPAGDPDGETPGKDAPGKDAPGKDAPGKDAPGKDAPGKDAPKEEKPKDAPKQDEPKQEAPKQEAPKEAPKQGDDGDEAADAKEPEGPKRLESGNVRFVLVGDADMISNAFRPQVGVLTSINGASGFAFTYNMADWLSGSDELMALRSRATNPRNLSQIDEDEERLLGYLNLLLVPLLVLLAGMTVFIVRRS